MLSKRKLVWPDQRREAEPIARPRPWQLAAIEQAVAASLSIAPAAFRNASRGSAAAARARQIAMYLARTKLELSYAAIGQAFRRDRTTVAHACRTVEELREQAAADQLLTELEEALEPRLAACGFIVRGA